MDRGAKSLEDTMSSIKSRADEAIKGKHRRSKSDSYSENIKSVDGFERA